MHKNPTDDGTPNSIIIATLPPPVVDIPPPPIEPIGFVVPPVGVEQVLLEALPPNWIDPAPGVAAEPNGSVEPGLGTPVSFDRKNFGVTRPLVVVVPVVAASGKGPHSGMLLPFSNDAVDESGLGQIGDGDGVWQTGDEPLSGGGWKSNFRFTDELSGLGRNGHGDMDRRVTNFRVGEGEVVGYCNPMPPRLKQIRSRTDYSFAQHVSWDASVSLPRRRWAGAVVRADRGQRNVQWVLQIVTHRFRGRPVERPVLRGQGQILATLRHLHRVVDLPFVVNLAAVAHIGTFLLPQLRYSWRQSRARGRSTTTSCSSAVPARAGTAIGNVGQWTEASRKPPNARCKDVRKRRRE
uniref:Uncharacterized protein n=1 Tax=Anopheles farauti TaxID=69004 RepID=A0A182QD55_9DIPT